MRTLGLSFLVAVGTLIAMAIAGFGFFVSGGGLIYPSIVAWVAGSLFALERRPRHYWLHVAAIGVFVAGLMNFYGFAMFRMFQPPPGAIRGGPNMPMPAGPPPEFPPIK